MNQIKRTPKWLIGIDEAGRGPLAGPVYVGVVAVPIQDGEGTYDFSIYKKLKDSKAMTELQRKAVREVLQDEVNARTIHAIHAYADSYTVDADGINPATTQAITQALSQLESRYTIIPHEARVVLDGGLQAPERYSDQETIIGGDDIEPVISLASVLAKVERDNHLVRLSEKYPVYGFEGHKGYGTTAHREAIREHGLCPIHRRSYCKKFITSTS